jgi:glycine/D-amino acid oxidase-like deaminating enzyme
MPAHLPRRQNVDVAVIGGGILGLASALHAARAGKTVQVLEASAVGDGPSGLGGGQVIPGLQEDAASLAARFGKAKGKILADFAATAADRVFDLIAEERMRVPHLRSGIIAAAHTETALAHAAKRVAEARAAGADASLLSARDIAALTGTQRYIGGWLDRRGGVIDPLSFTLELARVATAAGAAIAEHARASRITRENGRWLVEIADGTRLASTAVVVATNASSDDLVPGLRRTFVAQNAMHIATAPLPAEIAAAILPQSHAVSDFHRTITHYRKSADGRLVLSGRGGIADPRDPEDWRPLVDAMARLFPALADVPVEHRWFSRVAMTPDHTPHVHEPEKGMIAAIGCQGRGAALMAALGRSVARYLQTGDPDAIPVPITPIRPMPFHALHKMREATTTAWYRLRDLTES